MLPLNSCSESCWTALWTQGGSRKVPLLLRIALGAMLLICFGGVCGLVILVGADTGNIGLLLLGVLLTASLLYWIVHTVRNFRENRKGR